MVAGLQAPNTTRGYIWILYWLPLHKDVIGENADNLRGPPHPVIVV